jgi:CMP-N,N'-diacetyllegionaminic acid synthase
VREINPSEVLVVIPARGGSKGIPKKNIKVLAGKPLIAWTICSVLEENCLMKVVVSTDDEEIAEVSKSFGAEVLRRPSWLSGDDSPTDRTLVHTFETLEVSNKFSHIVLLQPTSPIRRFGVISQAFNQLVGDNSDSLVGASEISPFIWHGETANARPSYDLVNRKMRQNFALSDTSYLENGSIYVTSSSALKKSGSRVSGRVSIFAMSKVESLEIDTLDDFESVERLLLSR